MNKFVICPYCGQGLEIQDIGFYTYAFPAIFNRPEAILNANMNDFVSKLRADIKFDPQSTQCILNKEQDNL